MRHRMAALAGAVAFALLITPSAADPQQPGKIARIGWISGRSPLPHDEGLREGLRELGYREGENVALELRFADGKLDRLPELAAELVRLKVDVVVANTTAGALAMKQATRTIPIVFVGVSDPAGAGLVASFARPGGNITGLSNLSPELNKKRLELLKEAVLKVTRVGVLMNPPDPRDSSVWDESQAAAKALGVELQRVDVRRPEDFESAFTAMTKGGTDALFVPLHPFILAHRSKIVDLAVKSRLPAMYGAKVFVDAGGLMAYGPNFRDLFRRAATYVDKILKGAKPADLPVEQPMRFELVINMKTAKALGLTFPPSILVRANQVIR